MVVVAIKVPWPQQWLHITDTWKQPDYFSLLFLPWQHEHKVSSLCLGKVQIVKHDLAYSQVKKNDYKVFSRFDKEQMNVKISFFVTSVGFSYGDSLVEGGQKGWKTKSLDSIFNTVKKKKSGLLWPLSLLLGALRMSPTFMPDLGRASRTLCRWVERMTLCQKKKYQQGFQHKLGLQLCLEACVHVYVFPPFSLFENGRS